ncbi:TauD/TfdA family dioxygenase [Frankia sp. CNm7]|uniref:TauD/TfdA family dioxygenase n=1 Tax=Frankia nepalensis TaxID=1836974 RepID=A0A937UV09_9ACTN|nr:TauD/TfdA family dioxygenase [Frankia nepalensis]MBL7502583.1 TauD/TfdA family dioxygenase [Frankia nepalensis]MBL7514652.1 TauD/TfdA family dioxygenase [Frankia nepalensis]MBL7521929.1 TauD/TfdA family dioxygenase [Frankia nepalensis]MBL7631756.1 TauD/TfdA family dioxygenase [Frankia nepalensis]
MNSAGSVTVLELGDLTLPALWLRDACGCDQCRHPGTGQRLVGSARVARLFPDTAVTRHEVADGRLTVVFAPDGHRSTFDLDWLARNAPGRAARTADQSERGRVLWTSTDLPAGPPRVAWDAYLRSPVAMATALGAVSALGVAILTEVPARPGMVLTVARTFGFVRETNYGALFDVRIEPNPTHLAYTGAELAPHTDNPYRDPVPTVQLLHCLRTAGEGGDSVLVDGFAAASRLRDVDPAAFETLTRVWLPFRYDGPMTILTARAPLITLDDEGAVTQVRWNDRALQPPDVGPDRMAEVYRALAAFAAVLEAPDLAVSPRLAPGDCLIFDNTRVLHGRTAFQPDPAGGGRHLQGGYVDMDGLRGTLDLLRRDGGGARLVPTAPPPSGVPVARTARAAAPAVAR